MTVVYEDNHIIIVNKTASEIVQGDKTGDTPLSETVKLYLKEKYQKPGNVFIGVTHRLDRPVSGLVIFAKTSKALTRLNEMFKDCITPEELCGELIKLIFDYAQYVDEGGTELFKSNMSTLYVLYNALQDVKELETH